MQDVTITTMTKSQGAADAGQQPQSYNRPPLFRNKGYRDMKQTFLVTFKGVTKIIMPGDDKFSPNPHTMIVEDVEAVIKAGLFKLGPGVNCKSFSVSGKLSRPVKEKEGAKK